MFKKSMKRAIGPSIGVMIGLTISRVLFANLYNETSPSIFVHAILGLVTGYIGSFGVCLLIEYIKTKCNDRL